MISLKSAREIEIMRRANIIVAEVLQALKERDDLCPHVAIFSEDLDGVSDLHRQRQPDFLEPAVPPLGRHPLDRFLNDALVQTVFALKEHWLPGFVAGRISFSDKPQRLEYLLKTDASPDTLHATTARLNDPQLARETRGSLLTVLATVGGAGELALVLAPQSYTDASGRYDADLHARLLPQLGLAATVRKIRPNGDLEGRLQPMLQSSNVNLRAEALKLAGTWKLGTLRQSLETTATSASESEQIRCAAVEGLGNFGDPDARRTVERLTSASQPATVRCAAIVAEIGSHPKSAAEAAAAFLNAASEDSLVDQLFGAFLARPKASTLLAQALTITKPAADAAKIGLRRMSASGQANETLLNVLIDAAGLRREKKLLGTAEISALAGEVRKEGRADRGADIYARAELNCSACHTINGKGGRIGPDLSALGTAQPFEFIIGAILYPNREVKEGFVAFELTTKNGEIHQGYIVRESSNEVVMNDVIAGQEARVAKVDIAMRRQLGSVMPEGLADSLTHSEFRDLVKFLSTLGQHP